MARIPFPRPGVRSPFNGGRDAPVEVELFGDYGCPYARKAFRLATKVLPKYGERISFVHHMVSQPWIVHAISFHHATAILDLKKPEASWNYIAASYNMVETLTEQEFKDLTIRQLDEKAAVLASEISGLPIEEVAAEQTITSASTLRFKDLMKFHRSLGIHLTPTLRVNGTLTPQFESSWTEEDWDNFLAPILAKAGSKL